MQKDINKNNRRRDKYDVITNPRSIVPTDLCSIFGFQPPMNSRECIKKEVEIGSQ
jgi:hypothetical protein